MASLEANEAAVAHHLASAQEKLNQVPEQKAQIEASFTEAKQVAERTDPLAILSRKIRRDEYLERSDLKAWAHYNHLVFSENEQEAV